MRTAAAWGFIFGIAKLAWARALYSLLPVPVPVPVHCHRTGRSSTRVVEHSPGVLSASQMPSPSWWRIMFQNRGSVKLPAATKLDGLVYTPWDPARFANLILVDLQNTEQAPKEQRQEIRDTCQFLLAKHEHQPITAITHRCTRKSEGMN
jgi:hypothetical protein